MAFATMVPAKAAPSVRHITQQFQAWSLACDETIASKTKVCSVTQDVFGPGGALAFHWELTDAPGDRTKVSIVLAPLLDKSVIVLRTGGQGTIVDAIKCTPASCTASTVFPAQSLNVMAAGGSTTAQFIYMNATGSIITLSGLGFADAWRAMRGEVPGNELMTSSFQPSKATSHQKILVTSRFR